MRVLIIDDERLARSELRRLLLPHADVEVAEECADAQEAQMAIARVEPDLIFLDVQMPGGSGFDLLAALDNVPDVIFTTAFDSYALKAFEVNALDFLHKPIQAERLALALDRARSRQPPARETSDALDRIFIKDGHRCWIVSLAQISILESEGNYTRVYFGGNRPLILRSLNQLEGRLDGGRFWRANRRQIVNLDYVEHVEVNAAGNLVLVLKDALRIEMSRRRSTEFRQRTSL